MFKEAKYECVDLWNWFYLLLFFEILKLFRKGIFLFNWEGGYWVASAVMIIFYKRVQYLRVSYRLQIQEFNSSILSGGTCGNDWIMTFGFVWRWIIVFCMSRLNKNSQNVVKAYWVLPLGYVGGRVVSGISFKSWGSENLLHWRLWIVL